MMKRSVFLIAAICVMAGQVLALDIDAPSWRGAERSTMQAWEFTTPDPMQLPDICQSVFGPMPANMLGAWCQNDPVVCDPMGLGVFQGQFDVMIPNFPEGLEKKVRVQVTWMTNPAATCPAPAGMLNVQVDNPVGTVTGGLINEYVIGNTPWVQSVYEFTLQPNPDFEMVLVSTNAGWIDGIVIDTICPEPATIALLGFGMLVVFKPRR